MRSLSYAAVSTYDWLLVLHLLAAFCFVSGSVVAGILHWLAMRRDRPSEIALLLGLVRPMVVVIGVGSLAALGFGIWLTQDDPDGIALGDGWVIAAIVLWLAAGALAGPGGKRLRQARELAERLAADGDRPSEALHEAVADRSALVLNYASFAMVLAILVLMVFKPGAG
ncbi:MAG: DUF2269 family protein [Verrucomicrobiota bacterium]